MARAGSDERAGLTGAFASLTNRGESKRQNRRATLRPSSGPTTGAPTTATTGPNGSTGSLTTPRRRPDSGSQPTCTDGMGSEGHDRLRRSDASGLRRQRQRDGRIQRHENLREEGGGRDSATGSHDRLRPDHGRQVQIRPTSAIRPRPYLPAATTTETTPKGQRTPRRAHRPAGRGLREHVRQRHVQHVVHGQGVVHVETGLQRVAEALVDVLPVCLGQDHAREADGEPNFGNPAASPGYDMSTRLPRGKRGRRPRAAFAQTADPTDLTSLRRSGSSADATSRRWSWSRPIAARIRAPG